MNGIFLLIFLLFDIAIQTCRFFQVRAFKIIVSANIPANVGWTTINQLFEKK